MNLSHRKLFSATILAVVALFILMFTSASADSPTLTSHASTDFTGADVVTVNEPGGITDVGIPVSFPVGSVTGWNIIATYFQYNHATDTMYVGIQSNEKTLRIS